MNKAVIPEKYSVPTAEELTAKFHQVFRYTHIQKIMAIIFAGAVIYLDNIGVHGETMPLHPEQLIRVLNILSSHNLTLNRGDHLHCAHN